MSRRDPTIRERKLRLKAGNIKKGLVLCQVWVPADHRDDLYDIARGWRNAHDSQTTLKKRIERDYRAG